MLPSSSLVLASFCLVHALQMLATRADLQLHVAFIAMLPSSLLVLASFYPVHALQMLANYVQRATCSRATLVEKKAPASNTCSEQIARVLPVTSILFMS